MEKCATCAFQISESHDKDDKLQPYLSLALFRPLRHVFGSLKIICSRFFFFDIKELFLQKVFCACLVSIRNDENQL